MTNNVFVNEPVADAKYPDAECPDTSGLRYAASQLRISEPDIAERFLWLEAMINQIPDFIYAKDREERFLYANQAIIKGNGLSSVEEIIGLTDLDLHGKAAENALISEIEQRVMQTGEPDLGYEEPALTGGDRWLMMSRVPLRDGNGNIIGVVGTSRDISARKASERLMLAQNHILELILSSVSIPKFMNELVKLIEGVAEGICSVGVVFPSESHLPICIVSSAPILPTLLSDALASTSPTLIRKTLIGLESTLANFHTFEISAASGGNRGLIAVWSTKGSLSESLLKFLLGASQMAGMAIDRRQSEEQIRVLVHHDALTGLMNRSSIEATLPELLAASEITSQNVAIGFIDIDNFKLINDTLGHPAGDELLKKTAARISMIIGETDMVARIGGDEFIVVLSQNSERFEDRFERIRGTVAQPLAIDDIELRTHCSIGIAFFPDHGTTTSDLFKAADLAMYRAKENGRNNVQTFSQELAESGRHKFLRAKELKQAVLNNEFVLHYQPQINLVTGLITGVEALVRWMHPKEGLLPPSEFISLAEETGIIVELGEIVLNKACEQARKWQDETKTPIKVSVNMSPRQFQNANLIQQVANALMASGLHASLLEIEITESSLMKDVDSALTMMAELTGMGVDLAIDDFGTGYSCLSMLKSMPLSRLKIDRSFILNSLEFERDRTIVSTIIALAKGLGLEVVAEGIELEDQAKFLRKAGCEYGQGYLYSRPVAATEINKWLTRSH